MRIAYSSVVLGFPQCLAIAQCYASIILFQQMCSVTSLSYSELLKGFRSHISY